MTIEISLKPMHGPLLAERIGTARLETETLAMALRIFRLRRRLAGRGPLHDWPGLEVRLETQLGEVVG